ncbi:MAG: hypothetical protein H7A25_26600 [Leptospiraceae bacterium]|nr:hypothetical protein [Leptospiraceae bacterium]MCP5503498.1 hypothetical protein [Leptospiraceae bacterium]
MKLEFENPSALIYYNPEIHCIEVHWNSTDLFRFEEYKEVLNQGLKLLILHQTNKWLADTREISRISVEGKDWLERDWFLRVIKSIKKIRIAILLPYSPLTKLSIDHTLNIDVLEQKYFQELDEARGWLKKA